ncbi:MAG: Uma2 family endonuclease [Planctomycetaceae bacterium]
MSRPQNLAEDLVTVDEFFRLVPDGQKADLLDGVVHMASPDSNRANQLNNFLDFVVTGFVTARDLGGRVYVNRFAFELSDTYAPEPDLAYVIRERLHLIEETRMRGGPDVAVEIVSRDSRTRDYLEKKEVYREAGVGEYWIIDPLQRRVEFWRLSAGRYELVPLEENRIFRSQVLPGFWLDIEWLLSDPLPNAYCCLQEILAAAP